MIKKALLIFICSCLLFIFNQKSFAVEKEKDFLCPELSAFSNCYTRAPTVQRNLFWKPFGSFLLPGLDQYLEKRVVSGVSYSSYAIAGLGLTIHAADLRDKDGDGNPDDSSDGLDSRNNLARQEMLGLQMYQTAGSLSAYQAYRSALRGYQVRGKYKFIKNDEKTTDLILAPMDLSFFLKPTAAIPILGIALLMADEVNSRKIADKYINGSDVFYGSAFSLQAGVGEEAIFRGYIMPQFHESFIASDSAAFWANTTTATLFALAHLSSENRYPVWQLGLGWYLGWVTQKNEYSLRESIFIHTWWDIVAFMGSYLYDSKSERQVYLPILSGSFE